MATQLTIGDKTYTIGALPASLALKAALIVGKWQGRLLAKLAGNGVGTLAEMGASEGAMAQAGGLLVEHRALMLADPEYQEHVWKPLLSVCMCDGHSVMGPTFEVAYQGASLPVLLQLHDAAKEASCGPFVAGLGKMAL
jgi:hypothetical protein